MLNFGIPVKFVNWYQLLDAKKKRNRKKAKEIPQKVMKKELKTIKNELKNSTITVKNEGARAGPSEKPKNKKNKTQETEGSEAGNGSLLKRLKMLQKGKITSEELQKTSPLIKPKKQTVSKEEEMDRNREEVLRLNMQIQSKIAQQIKPKLREIMNRPAQQPSKDLNGFTRHQTLSESSQIQREPQIPSYLRELKLPTSATKPRFNQKSTRAVPIAKTSLKLSSDDEVEIYRYSQDDLNQLQSTATWELVPRLRTLRICATPSNDFDSFLLKLLNMKDNDERQLAILDAAEERKFIKRLGPTTFEYSQMASTEEEEEKPTLERPHFKMNKEETKREKIELLKSSVSDDKELNEMVYRIEFLDLFDDVLPADQKIKSITDMVNYLVENNQAYVIEGEVRVNSRNNQEAYVSNPKGKRDICISKLILRKFTFQGDYAKVLVKQKTAGDDDLNSSNDEMLEPLVTDDDAPTVENADTNRNYGCVFEILENRHSGRVIGSIAPLTKTNRKHKRYVAFNVRDTKVPNILIGSDGIPKNEELTDKQLMVAQITGWRLDQPKGKIVKIIGEKGQLQAENEAILLQNNLKPEPFAQHILDQLPTEPFEIPSEEFKYREDLREKCIFSIDPETARDLDDALSCEVLPNGNFEIGVHISDVSYFLKENSELDEIVKEKATTIYLVDTVYHMLPVPLCLLCSLLPGADKMAYSVFWEINEKAEILNTRFTRSVLNSCAKLSYDHAQMVIEKENDDWSDLEKDFPEIHNNFTVSDVANVIVKLQKIAVILRTKRKENGALKIDQPKISFRFDKDDQRMEAPVDFFKYCTKDSNRLIEEFMLLANISVAQFIYEKFPEISLLRHHDPPNASGMKKLTKTLEKNGINLDTTTSTALSDSMERQVASASMTAGVNAVLNLLVSKTMSRAKYFCSSFCDESGFWHYALSIPMYTHFTSPIRRYADCLVHRVLNAALGYEAAPSRTPDEVQQLASICNAQKHAAKLAGDDSCNLYFMQFIQSLKSKAMLAGVVGVFDFNLEVVLVETGHVIKVYYKVSFTF